MTLQRPQSYGRVAVLYGGWSVEREVSLNSGAAVCRGLIEAGVNAELVDVTRESLKQLPTEGYDRVFNVLHGIGGEDGIIQGMLEAFGIPYTGSSIKASALTMDKIMTKQLWKSYGLPTPQFAEVEADTDWTALVETLGLPLIVKPVGEGSSVGMSRVDSVDALPAAWSLAAETGDRVFVEKWITGEEYTVSVLEGEVLPAIRLETPHVFYDYSAKYQSDDTQYYCPCGLNKETEDELAALVLRAFEVTGASGWGRVDLMRDEQGNFLLIEVNTVPGMTDHSLVPKAAKVAGMSFSELVTRILDTSLDSAEVNHDA